MIEQPVHRGSFADNGEEIVEYGSKVIGSDHVLVVMDVRRKLSWELETHVQSNAIGSASPSMNWRSS